MGKSATAKAWGLQPHTRAFIIDRGFAEQSVDAVMKWGYYVHDFSPYHVRIQDAVDFWPTRLKWRCAKGYNFDKQGQGLDSLRRYLTQYVPLGEKSEFSQS